MGQFNNVELYDEIIEIPERVALNTKATGLLYYLIILEQEKAHKKYLALYKKFPANMEQLDETAKIIEEERTRTFTEFLNELNSERDALVPSKLPEVAQDIKE
jgi:hypothetical protein